MEMAGSRALQRKRGREKIGHRPRNPALFTPSPVTAQNRATISPLQPSSQQPVGEQVSGGIFSGRRWRLGRLRRWETVFFLDVSSFVLNCTHGYEPVRRLQGEASWSVQLLENLPGSGRRLLNNSYEGFETLVEAQYNYSNFLSQQEAMEDVAGEGNMTMAEQMLANQTIAQMDNDHKPSRIKDFVIVVLVVLIIKLLLF